MQKVSQFIQQHPLTFSRHLPHDGTETLLNKLWYFLQVGILCRTFCFYIEFGNSFRFAPINYLQVCKVSCLLIMILIETLTTLVYENGAIRSLPKQVIYKTSSIFLMCPSSPLSRLYIMPLWGPSPRRKAKVCWWDPGFTLSTVMCCITLCCVCQEQYKVWMYYPNVILSCGCHLICCVFMCVCRFPQ